MKKKLARIILIVIAISYGLMSNIFYTQTVASLSEFTINSWGIDFREYFGGMVREGTPEGLNYFFSVYFFPIGTFISSIITLAGIFIYSKNRSMLSGFALFMASALPKENSNWGRVYDINTKKEISFAVIRLFKDSSFVSQAVADVYGRYKFTLSGVVETNAKGFELEVSAENYQQTKIPLKDILADGAKEFDVDIGLTSDSQIKLSDSTIFRNKFYYQLAYIIYANSIYNFLAGVIYTVIYPETIYGPLMIISYAIVLIWNSFVIRDSRSFLISKAFDFDTKKPLSNVVIDLFSLEGRVDNCTTGENGVIAFNFVRPGKYTIKAYKTGYEWVDSKGSIIKDKSEIVITKKGYLNQNIHLKSPNKNSSSENSSGNMMNPFS